MCVSIRAATSITRRAGLGAAKTSPRGMGAIATMAFRRRITAATALAPSTSRAVARTGAFDRHSGVRVVSSITALIFGSTTIGVGTGASFTTSRQAALSGGRYSVRVADRLTKIRGLKNPLKGSTATTSVRIAAIRASARATAIRGTSSGEVRIFGRAISNRRVWCRACFSRILGARAVCRCAS